jgi:MFS family permease
VGSIEAIIPVLATDLKGGGAENIGFIQTCFGLGTILAALLISIRSINNREVMFLFGSVFLIGLLLVMISGMHMSGVRVIMPFLVFFLFIGACIIFAGTSFRSILQKEVNDMMMGRVFGFVSSVGNISIPVAILIYGFLLEYLPHHVILAISGLILMPTCILAHHKYVATLSTQQQRGSII